MGKEKHRDGWLEKLLSKLGSILFWRSGRRREGWFGFGESWACVDAVAGRFGLLPGWGFVGHPFHSIPHFLFSFKTVHPPSHTHFQTLVLLQQFHFPNPPFSPPSSVYFVKPVRNSWWRLLGFCLSAVKVTFLGEDIYILQLHRWRCIPKSIGQVVGAVRFHGGRVGMERLWVGWFGIAVVVVVMVMISIATTPAPNPPKPHPSLP